MFNFLCQATTVFKYRRCFTQLLKPVTQKAMAKRKEKDKKENERKNQTFMLPQVLIRLTFPRRYFLSTLLSDFLFLFCIHFFSCFFFNCFSSIFFQYLLVNSLTLFFFSFALIFFLFFFYIFSSTSFLHFSCNIFN